jgi:hypothetical protein
MNTLPSIPGIVLNLMAKPCQEFNPPSTIAVAEPLENHRQRIDGQETVHLRHAYGRCHAFMVVRVRSRKTQGVKIRREDGLTSGV